MTSNDNNITIEIFNKGIQEIKTEVKQINNELHQEIKDTRNELLTEIRINEVGTSHLQTSIYWGFAIMGIVIALVGLIVAILALNPSRREKTEKEPEYKPNSDGSVFEEEVIIEESTVKIIPIEESAPENQEPVMIQTSALEPDESVTKESTDVSVQQIMDDKQLITNNKPKKEEKKMKHRHGRKKRVAWWIPIGFLFTLAAGIAIGYHIGIRQVPAPLDLVGYEESDSLQDSTAVEIKDTKKATSTTAEEIQKKEKQQETVAGPVELKEEGNKPAKESVEIAPISANDSQVLRNAKQMVSKGAYSIVGTMETVTVRPGQNIKKISKFYLGEGMECYIQAYNNVEEVTEGMKLKIPQVKLKKK